MKICEKCRNIFETHQLSVKCNGPCSGQFHQKCTNLNENEINCLKSSTNIKWLCDFCSVSESVCKTNNYNKDNVSGKLIDPKAKDINPEQSDTLYGHISKRKKIIIPVLLTFMTMLVVATILGIRALNDSKIYIAAEDNVGGGYILRMVPRDGWLAQPPLNNWVPLNLPVKRVIVIPTRTQECETQASCTYTVRITQTYNIESQQQDDIIYNFLIGGDGNVYEGRGWNNKGSVIKGFNDDSISFAYIGSFKKQPPSYRQLNVTKLLLEEGVRLKKLSPDYEIVGANKLDPTSVTTIADALYKSFENWPHWSDK